MEHLKVNIEYMNEVKWGIIGPGTIAHRFADGLKEAPSGELIAIASKTQDRRSSFGNKYNIDPALRFNNYEEIIKNNVMIKILMHQNFTVIHPNVIQNYHPKL